MLANLENAYGVAFISVVIAASLHGVSLFQALYYYANHNDTWHIKLTVAVVVMLEAIHQAFITHAIYKFSITDWGKPDKIQFLVWSLLFQVALTGLTAFIVQCFLTLRVWRLSVRNKYLTGSSAILVVGSFVSLIVYVARACQFEDISSLAQLKWLSISANVLAVAADSLIAAILCILLNSGFRKSKSSAAIINKLIISAVNTGLLTSLCALGSLISILVASKSFIYTTFFVCIGRLYTNSLLATLNARELQRPAGIAVDAPLSLRDLPKSPIPAQRPKISIKIDTVQEFHGEKDHDGYLGEESD